MGKRVDGPMAFVSDVGSFRVQPNRAGRLPVARITRPAFWPRGSGKFIDAVAFGEQGPVLAAMALVGRDEAQRAVKVLKVMPAHEALNPGPRLVDGREAAGGPVGHVFASPEQGFFESDCRC